MTVPDLPRRRRYFINKSLQIKFIALVLSLFLLATLSVWLDAYLHISGLFAKQELSDVQYLSMMYALNYVILVKLVIALVIVGFVSILFSHLIAGPAYHIKRIMETVRDGDTNARVHLRKWDELKDVAEAFNEMMDSLQKKIR